MSIHILSSIWREAPKKKPGAAGSGVNDSVKRSLSPESVLNQCARIVLVSGMVLVPPVLRRCKIDLL